jgi:magnesium-dependent phosphatase-1
MIYKMAVKQKISLVVLDGDDTLWYGLDGGFISGVTYQDVGRDNFTFTPLSPDVIQRSDGQRFQLFPEVRSVLNELHARGALVSLASYNCPAPVYNALKAFGLQEQFQHPVVEWSSQKDHMLKQIIRAFQEDGFAVEPANTLFIDDDRYGRYRPQMARLGVAFLQRGVDIHDLSEILEHPQYEIVTALRKGVT